jgi:hypothetical protein
MFGPPLEGFHRGATCVTTEVTGHEEYIEHGVNALVVDWDDRRGTARQLDLLARDRMLLHRLRCGALETARDWPTGTARGSSWPWRCAPSPTPRRPRPTPTSRACSATCARAWRPSGCSCRSAGSSTRGSSAAQRLERLPGIKQALRVKRSRYGRAAIRVARPVKRRLLGP